MANSVITNLTLNMHMQLPLSYSVLVNFELKLFIGAVNNSCEVCDRIKPHGEEVLGYNCTVYH